MANVTLRVLDGSDRGRVYEALSTPVTIGREEGNSIQLNDDRISRFHVKIQEDSDKLILTDLESTNGTKVNGEEIQLRMLRYGDMITVGRSVLLFGSRDEIAGRLARLRGEDFQFPETIDREEVNLLESAVSLDFELKYGDDEDLQGTLHILEPPELPDNLGACQAAQLSELLEYLHIRVRRLLNSVRIHRQNGQNGGQKNGGKKADPDDDEQQVTLDQRQWQNLLDLQARLATYLREISEPGES